jgi:hypothetical protein
MTDVTVDRTTEVHEVTAAIARINQFICAHGSLALVVMWEAFLETVNREGQAAQKKEVA